MIDAQSSKLRRARELLARPVRNGRGWTSVSWNASLAALLLCVSLLSLGSPLKGAVSNESARTVEIAARADAGEQRSALRRGQKIVRVGIFLSQVKNLSLQDNQFEFDAYIWFRWNPADSITFYGEAEDLRPHETFELLGASNVDRKVLLERPGYAVLRVHGELSQYWDVSAFPFDKHEIYLGIEDSAREVDEVVFEPDFEGSVISPTVQIPGWAIDPLRVEQSVWEYGTTFGDPELEPGDHSYFSRITFQISLSRQWLTMLLKAFAGLFIAVGVALVPHFIDPREVDPRFGLSVGGLFAGVANQYVVSDSLPPTAGWTISDKIHMVAFFVILAAIIRSAIALHRVKTRGDDVVGRERRIDELTFFGLLGFWVAATCVVVMVGL